jgi:DNA-binding phage protein
VSGEGAHAERAPVPAVQAEGRDCSPGGAGGTRDLRVFLRKVQEAVRDRVPGHEAQDVTPIVRELKVLRAKRSLACVAGVAGMKRQQLHNIESGLTRNPGIRTVSRIAAALGYELVLAPLDDDDETL